VAARRGVNKTPALTVSSEPANTAPSPTPVPSRGSGPLRTRPMFCPRSTVQPGMGSRASQENPSSGASSRLNRLSRSYSANAPSIGASRPAAVSGPYPESIP
jgi:hypothetical protein